VNNLGRIDFSKFQGADLASDLNGRDFTINAMAVEVHQLQTLIDPLGGAADLISKRLRACSQRSFLDDPVRILRAVRFSVDLDLKIQRETVRLLRQAVDHLPEVSAERLRDEIFRILIQCHPGASLRILDQLDALKHILPEVCLLKGVQQSAPHIMDAWEHTLDVLTRLEDLFDLLADEFNTDKTGNLAMGLASVQLIKYRPYLIDHLNTSLNPERPHRGIIFLAGFYHDVGKLKTRSMDETGKTRFIDHEYVGSRLAEKRARELKLSNLEIDRLVTIVSHHMRPSLLSHSNTPLSKRAIYRFFRDTGAAGVDICMLSLADMLATYGPTLPQDRWARHLEAVRELLHMWWDHPEEGIFPAPLINGDGLIKELKISPGPMVGYLLEAIREAQVAGEIHTRQEAISLGRTLLQE
jgi:tRNA nucleotidyltransferase/poly(A) polymerase